MTALVDAMACYAIDRHQIDILSLGCVELEFAFTKDQIAKGGIRHWREIISAAMRLQSQNALGQAGLLVGRDRLLRVDGAPMKSNPIDLDDYTGPPQSYLLLLPHWSSNMRNGWPRFSLRRVHPTKRCMGQGLRTRK
ncbi:hypothetical protein NLY43_13915 [Mesorhizobium sp. C416B]|uniref:hypothetical protein n=1 Tax=unclassified Mesorhizobium TaxID=325217 RepID=UPI0003CF1E0A|nr:MULTISPECIES: hypothetical protein [unclassified Mesorhizobium]ESX41141.1 hypothetical protein X762_30380 [Mesorhizobium sp. LSHC426A00]ESX45436.1 hypothetical protein X761_32240 [Mesorhizobium sp. LSHC424B00]ESX59540.1 hypothetical protein X760_19340 [Mesorhizobium sp. LSHC422A00]ESX64345.1 hypothetical protein X758_31725 [Mesorhizobium sp. LSHC416B00]WJI65674.1 hypothetical protein NLY43_13915 [Mesorhizobium sp. C416B]